jgi:hypothetical protein
LGTFKRMNSSGFVQTLENRKIITRNRFILCKEKFLATDEIGRDENV